MKINIPTPSLIVLIGASGAGKSTFARRHFLPSEIISSDAARGLVCDDENSLEATNDAFDVVHFLAAKRLKNLKTVVIDATNVQKSSRASLIRLARDYHLFPVAIVLDVPEHLCHERNAARSDRDFGPHVVKNHLRALRSGLRGLEKEGFRAVHVLNLEAVENAELVRAPLYNDKRGEVGPFDIIGDVHGCADELESLLEKLGYAPDEVGVWRHPNRRAVFVGDLVDRGPRVADALELVWKMTEAGAAFCVAGNHDEKLLRFLKGKDVKISHGLDASIESLEARGDEFKTRAKKWLDSLVSHYVLDGGNLVVAHAGIKAELQGRASGAVRQFCLYGETTGESDEWGLPVRLNWARDYRGRASVVYGHTPIVAPHWENNTLNLDTGCVFGGQLTALRWPERELVSVEAKQVYVEPVRPLNWETQATNLADDVLDFADVSGKRILETRLLPKVTIQAENGAAALEILSRFGTDPRWLIHLPPTMSPVATAPEGSDFLEHPRAAWDYFRENGVSSVVCEEKHMGSRAICVVCRDEKSALKRFGIEGESGAIWTRTGRRFFEAGDLETQFLERLRSAISACNWWEKFESDWFCLDAELMPWSAKAQELIRAQYAPVGAAGVGALSLAQNALDLAQKNGADVGILRGQIETRKEAVQAYERAFGRYCWPVESVEDLKFAPFHLLASEGRVHTEKNHVWHMETLAQLSHHDKIFVATPFRVVDLADENAVLEAENWWLQLTGSGGEGMVVKPLDFVVKRENYLVQPAMKVRGREYLRIIYGPEYLLPQNLERLRKRGLAAKRSLALREFALGLEALNRFVERDSARRVHECIWGVLALESEPVDPRL